MSRISFLSRIVAIGVFLAATGASFGASSDYRIQAEDFIEITVFEEPDLTRKARVQGSGTISYPLLKSVPVAGKTAHEVETTIRDLLAKDYLVNPQVTINILEYSLQNISVLGAVRAPGSYPLPPEKKIELPEAISYAGGLTPGAQKKKIKVFRDGKEREFDHDKVLKNTDPKKKFYIKPGDIIEVPERFF